MIYALAVLVLLCSAYLALTSRTEAERRVTRRAKMQRLLDLEERCRKLQETRDEMLRLSQQVRDGDDSVPGYYHVPPGARELTWTLSELRRETHRLRQQLGMHGASHDELADWDGDDQVDALLEEIGR